MEVKRNASPKDLMSGKRRKPGGEKNPSRLSSSKAYKEIKHAECKIF